MPWTCRPGWASGRPGWPAASWKPTAAATPSMPWCWPPAPTRSRCRVRPAARAAHRGRRPGPAPRCCGPARPLALVGAGWIGAESATAAAGLGCQVTVVEAAAVRWPARCPEFVARPMAWYAEAGVDLRLGRASPPWSPAGWRWPARTAAGRRGGHRVGVRPATGWLAGSGVETGDGDRGRRAAAHLAARRVRRRGLRRLPVGPLRRAAAYPALGRALHAPGGPRPTCWAAARPTTRCRTSGPSSSGGWSSTPAPRRRRTGLARRPAGRRARRRQRRGPGPGRAPLGGGVAGRGPPRRAAQRQHPARYAPGPPGHQLRRAGRPGPAG